jgi:hypothetical protein
MNTIRGMETQPGLVGAALTQRLRVLPGAFGARKSGKSTVSL